MSLSADLLREIAGTAAEVACKMALVCVEWRSAVEAGVGGSFDVRHGLLCLDETALMGELTVALALSPTTVKLAPHTRKRNRYGGCYNIFASLCSCDKSAPSRLIGATCSRRPLDGRPRESGGGRSASQAGGPIIRDPKHGETIPRNRHTRNRARESPLQTWNP